MAPCQILYDGLDYQTKTLLETMCQEAFLQKDENQDWDLFEDLAEKTLQWEPASKKTKEFTIYSFKRRAPIPKIIYNYRS